MEPVPDEALVRADPLGDLFLSAASLILALLLVSLAARPPLPSPDTATRPAAPAWPAADLLYAGAGGALYGASGARSALDGLADDPALGLWIARHRAPGPSLLFVIGADGGETAVALEPLLAARGPQPIAVARLPGSCPGWDRLDRLRACLAAAGLAIAGP